ncbi:MAG: hypothetical protein SCM96_05015 [Acidobacteriota bacterium]|nr:hypothetical protein [Acidobacteriota bacterium]
MKDKQHRSKRDGTSMRAGLFLRAAFLSYLSATILLILPVAGSAGAATDAAGSDALFQAFSWRAVGPARQGGRILHIEALPERPFTFYIAPSTGGLWKTENNGTTFTSLLPEESNVPIGHFALAPSNPEIIWVGTGDPASGRLPLRGFGIYQSTDGGKSWTHRGLEATRHIGRIAVDPRDPDIVYVAAVGYHFSFNPERGLYKTVDGGLTWEKVFDAGDKVGVVDVLLNPSNPDIVFLAAYDKQRIPWNFQDGGPDGGIFKSTDAGKTWRKIEAGLPGGGLARIGLAVYPKNPDIMVASIDNVNMRPPTAVEAERDRRLGGEPRERPIGGEVYRSEDGGETWTKMSRDGESVGGGKWYGQIYLDPNDDQVVYVPSVPLLRSLDGGRTWGEKGPENLADNVHVDHHAIWINPKDSRHILLGNDGGLAASYDFGATWDVYENLPLAQYYAIGVDMEEPYNIYGGTQDNGSIKFPCNGPTGFITRDDWVSVGGGDGMFNQVDPEDSRWLYNASQLGAMQRVDQKTGTRKFLRPARPKGEPPYRFNWTAPIHISSHNPRIIYLGAQVLLRSLDRGDDWREASPDLTTNDPEKIKGNIEFCTLTSISESPLTPGLIWCGTDDGKVQVTRDGGASWTDATAAIDAAGAPADFYVTRVAASPHQEGRAFITKSGWHRDDYRPFVLRTDDFGATWTDLSAGLPEGTVYVVGEDRKNPDLLFAGTEFGVYATLDGGRTWSAMGTGLPANAMVQDMLIHPRENDLIAATHGRGAFIVNISPLQEIRADFASESVHLFEIRPALRWSWQRSMFDVFGGHRHYTVPNEPIGLTVHYHLKSRTARPPKITIADACGAPLAVFEGKTEPGLHAFFWDLTYAPPAEGKTAARKTAEPGDYLVVLEVDGLKLTQKAIVRPMPERR